MREQQEKASDKAAELDALRAKRAVAKQNQMERAREAAEEEKRARQVAEMNKARKQQSEMKQEAIKREALLEKAEFERVVKKMAEDEKRDQENEVRYKKKLLSHKSDLVGQISTNQGVKATALKEYQAEGRAIRQAHADEKKKLEEVKEKKISNLSNYGVPEKYRSELVKRKVKD